MKLRILFFLPTLFAFATPDISSIFLDKEGHVISQKGHHWIQPASVTKVLLALAFNPLETPQEKYFSSGFELIKDPAHPGQKNIVFKHFNPLLTSKKLTKLAKSFQNNHTIPDFAPLILIKPLFMQKKAGIFAKEKLECYSAAPTGFDINQNCQTISINIGHNESIRINDVLYHTENYSLQNCPFNTHYAPSAYINAKSLKIWHLEDQKKLIICSEKPRSKPLKAKIHTHQQILIKQLQQHFPNHPIQVREVPEIVFSKSPSTASWRTSVSLTTLIRKLLDESNNFLAQWLYSQIPQPLAPFLQDGSGLSRYNWITLNELAQHFHALPHTHPILFDLLPNENNHIIQRLNLKIPPHVHLKVKSGTLSYIKNLAGSIMVNQTPVYTFVISCTHPEAIEGACNAAISQTLTPFLEAAENL